MAFGTNPSVTVDFSRATAMMRKAVIDKVFPGAVLLVSVGGRILYHQAFGKANLISGQPVTPHTIFDLASLTKPLATVPAVMALVQEAKLNLEDRLGDVLPDFKPTDKAGIRIDQLLNHSSGLPAWRPYYEQLRTLPRQQRKTRLRQLLVSEKRIADIGVQTVYSDLGFMILCWIVEVLAGKPLPQFARARVYEPLGLTGHDDCLLYFPVDSPAGSTVPAATERCSWRNMLLEGSVHDDNAFVLGGYDGHAGLFGNAAGVHTLVNCLRMAYAGEKADPDLFDRSIVRRFFSRPTGGRRWLGFDAPSPQRSASGRHFSPNTVGHLGFTGTSFWMDLDRAIIVILLSNRVHPSRKNEKIKCFRPAIHDTVMIAIQDGLLAESGQNPNASG